MKGIFVFYSSSDAEQGEYLFYREAYCISLPEQGIFLLEGMIILMECVIILPATDIF